jgi:hypothetical protein
VEKRKAYALYFIDLIILAINGYNQQLFAIDNENKIHEGHVKMFMTSFADTNKTFCSLQNQLINVFQLHLNSTEEDNLINYFKQSITAFKHYPMIYFDQKNTKFKSFKSLLIKQTKIIADIINIIRILIDPDISQKKNHKIIIDVIIDDLLTNPIVTLNKTLEPIKGEINVFLEELTLLLLNKISSKQM